jgi:hypothetical protein
MFNGFEYEITLTPKQFRNLLDCETDCIEVSNEIVGNRKNLVRRCYRVFHQPSQTYWQGEFLACDNDGYNPGDDDVRFIRVEPHEITTTVFRPAKNNADKPTPRNAS